MNSEGQNNKRILIRDLQSEPADSDQFFTYDSEY